MQNLKRGGSQYRAAPSQGNPLEVETVTLLSTSLSLSLPQTVILLSTSLSLSLSLPRLQECAAR